MSCLVSIKSSSSARNNVSKGGYLMRLRHIFGVNMPVTIAVRGAIVFIITKFVQIAYIKKAIKKPGDIASPGSGSPNLVQEGFVESSRWFFGFAYSAAMVSPACLP
jgi:hypothetical protein